MHLTHVPCTSRPPLLPLYSAFHRSANAQLTHPPGSHQSVCLRADLDHAKDGVRTPTWITPKMGFLSLYSKMDPVAAMAVKVENSRARPQGSLNPPLAASAACGGWGRV